jgi:hypothetical protein
MPNFDPTACVDTINAITIRILKSIVPLPEESRLLAESALALNSWLAMGGRLPDQWVR